MTCLFKGDFKVAFNLPFYKFRGNAGFSRYYLEKRRALIEKTITYFYPDKNKAAHLKVFQDRTDQIKAFYFTKEHIKEIEKLDSSTYYAIYFLFDNSDSDNKKTYIGQSINGIKRIFDHIHKKEFWSYCILFVTDNNRF